MTTPTEITTSVLKGLMEKGLISLQHSETKEPLTIDDPMAQQLIKDLAEPLHDAIKGINVHRALGVPNAKIQDPEPLVLTAPCPSLDTPWTEEKMQEFSSILDKYEEDVYSEDVS